MKKGVSLIQSAQNPLYKTWMKLSSTAGIKKENQFFLMGQKLILDFFTHTNSKSKILRDFEIVAEIVGSSMLCLEEQKPKGLQEYLDQTKNLTWPCFQLSGELFNTLDILGTHFNLLVLRPVQNSQLVQWSPDSQPRGLEVILPLGDPGNAGALIRSAVAFGASKIILTREAAHPFLPKTLKASAGTALFKEVLKTDWSLLDILIKTQDGVALDARGESILDFKWNKNTRLILGEEGPGLPQKQIALRTSAVKDLIRIPTTPIESLNGAIAASLAMFHYRQTHKLQLDSGEI